MPTDSLEYAPTTGVKALREAVAHLYNDTYRQGKDSQYTFENASLSLSISLDHRLIAITCRFVLFLVAVLDSPELLLSLVMFTLSVIFRK